MEVAIHAVVLAFGLILPLGVQNVFIFNQGMSQRRYTHALPAVITAGISDTLLIGAAVGGVSLILLQWPLLANVLYGAGSLFLLYMAWSIWRSSESVESSQTVMSAGRQIAFAASVSLLNPHALLDTVAVIGTSSLQYEGVERMYFALTAAVVSWIWFLGLAGAGRVIGRTDRTGRISLMFNRLSAVVMVGLAVMMLWKLIYS
ncbi:MULTISPECIES: LysE/ArgO family amino acid transporter [unclassified Paenibacillus]|uniref:LysE/ArgO family amino acid transporter n=1 Tax=unclassified Paenibacillus TaxID=185978 RepID=UPI000CFB5140|nr:MULTISPECIES: LysE/ArgO family amino acid transporter [unclassified Paenibacillus]PRA03467.1 lysine transporter LysE [Paenibacillus sp. MYb63]PRA46885.1 lysine transporter LysE [Paenibacillus sp. MYb67]QZN76641.1 LysE/ArgO family amino acid transporter [Paenibacillus sp. DR312]